MSCDSCYYCDDMQNIIDDLRNENDKLQIQFNQSQEDLVSDKVFIAQLQEEISAHLKHTSELHAELRLLIHDKQEIEDENVKLRAQFKTLEKEPHDVTCYCVDCELNYKGSL